MPSNFSSAKASGSNFEWQPPHWASADGVRIDYMRIRGSPFSAQVQAFLDEHERVLVVEQNRDGQLRTLIVNECDVDGRRIESVLHYDGPPMAAGPLVDAIRARLPKGAAA